MEKFEGKTLSKAIFVMEDCYFINCVLTDCDLFYSGGDVEAVNTPMQNCRWHFRGPALRTMQLMHTAGMLKPGNVPPPPSPGNKSMMN
jgi:hypothetical protein